MKPTGPTRVARARLGARQDHRPTQLTLSGPVSSVSIVIDAGVPPDGSVDKTIHHLHHLHHVKSSDSLSSQGFCIIVTIITFILVAGFLAAATADWHDDHDDPPVAVHVVLDPVPIVAPAVTVDNSLFPADANTGAPASVSPTPVVCPPSEIPEHDHATNNPTGRCKPVIRAPNGTHPDMVDWTVVPKTNYFRFASGRWIDAAPAGSSRFFGAATANNAAILADVMTVTQANTASLSPLGSFIDSCLKHKSHFPADVAAAREAELRALATIDADVNSLPSGTTGHATAALSTASTAAAATTTAATTTPSAPFDVLWALATWHQLGHLTPVHFSATPSPLESGSLVLLVESLEYNPLDSIPKAEQAALVKFLLADFGADGVPIACARQQHVDAVLAISSLLVSRASLDYANVDMTEYVARYYPAHAFSLASLRRHFPALRWDSFISGAAAASRLSTDDAHAWENWAQSAEFWIWDTEQLAIIDAAVHQFSADQWKAYLLFLARIGMGDSLTTLWRNDDDDTGGGATAATTTATFQRSADVLRPEHHAHEHVGARGTQHSRIRLAHNHPRWRTARIAVSRAPSGSGEADGPITTSDATASYSDSSGASAFSSLAPHDVIRQRARGYCETQAGVYIPSLIDDAFTRTVLPDAKRQQIVKVVVSLVAALSKYIQANTALSAAGRSALAHKFASVRIRVGGPDYSGVRTGAPFAAQSFDSDFPGNVRAARAAMMKHQLVRAFGTFETWQDSSPFDMPAHVSNAYCDPQQQSISVLSGITTKPFDGNIVDPYSDASLLAGLGAIVGHEVWHLVDANGRRFDAGGALTSWLPVVDERVFVEFDNWIINAYAVPLPLTGEIGRSRQQVGEAAADVMGLTAAWTALVARASSAAVTPADAYEFCLFYAQMWANVETAETVHGRNVGDPHPLPEIRVNLALRTLAAWAQLAGKQLPPDRPRLLRQ